MSINSLALIVTAIEADSIKKTFERSENDIIEDVKAIRDWFKKQPHLPQNEDDDIIRRVLQFNKFSVERTKQKLDYYYAARNFAPIYLQHFQPLHASVQKVNNYAIFAPMPKLTADFGRVSIMKLISENCPDFSSAEYIKVIISQFEFRLKFDNYTHDIAIIDLLNTNFANTMSIRPTDVTKGYTILQKAYSERIKGIHFVNAPTYAMGFVNLLKRLFTKKMGNRIHLHPDMESLYTFIPKEILPIDYGGNEPTLIELHRNWVKFMESQNDWMIKRTEMKSNEKLRIGKPLDLEIFGVDGTFRKLNID